MKKIPLKKWACLLGLSSFLCLLLTACGPHSLEDFEKEGEEVILALIQDLQAIHSREQLLISSSKLQYHFDRLVALMIAAEEFSILHSELDKESLQINHELSDQLRAELNRLYRLEGGRETIEKSQEKALYQLDAFERAKRRNFSTH